MDIRELIVTDYKVLSTESDASLLKITTTGSYNIVLNKEYKTTKICITEWSNFSIKKFISNEPFGEMRETFLELKDLETFEYIQEIEMLDNHLYLRGFSNESGAWLIYEFVDPQVNIYFV